MAAAAYRLGSHIVLERLIEKATENIILRAHGAGQGGDVNAVTKQVVDGVVALRDTPLVQAAQSIPGFDHVPNLGLSILAELAEKKADGLWPSRSGPEWQLARSILKNLAPVLRGIGEGTADATQRLQEIHDSVDQTVSSTALPPASRKASMDVVAVITLPGFGVAQPFYPVSLDATGAPEIDAAGNVVVRDPAYNAFVRDYVARNITTIPGRQQRGGGRTPSTTRHPAPITQVYTLQEWATEASRASVDPQVAQRLLTAFKPKPSVHWWDRQTDDTRQKIVAIQLTRTRFSDRIPEGLGQRMDEEDLATSLQKSGAPPSMVHDFLVPVTVDADGCVSAQDLEHFWHASDTWLGANQSTATQTVKGFDLVVKKLKGFGIRGTSLSWLMASMVGLGGFLLLLYLGTLVSLFVIALLSLAVSVFLPMEMALPFSFGPFTDARSVAQVCATMAGWINFAVVLLLQLFGSQMGSFYHGARSFFDDDYKPPAPEAETGFKSVIQKLRIFGFFLAGTLFVLISLDGPVSYRLAWVTVVVGLMIASGSIQVDAGDREGLRERIIKSVPKFEFIFVVLPAAWILGTLVVEKIVSWFSTNLIANAQSWLSDPWHLAFAVIGVMGLVGAVLSYLQRDKQKNVNMGFQGWGLIVALALFALLAAWWNTTTVFDGWFEEETPTAAQTAPAASAPVTQPRPQSTRQPSEREKRAERQRKCDTKALSFVTCVDLYNKGKIDRHP